MPIDTQTVRRRLEAAHVFDVTRPYRGTFIGSIALDLHGEDADADIVCEAMDLAAFRNALTAAFGARPDFHIDADLYLDRPAMICRFALDGLPVEVFGRPEPLEGHESYRHFRAAERLLAIGGEGLRQAVRNLKAQGLKTEPAFAQALALPGRPFDAMLDLETAPDADLAALCRAAGFA